MLSRIFLDMDALQSCRSVFGLMVAFGDDGSIPHPSGSEVVVYALMPDAYISYTYLKSVGLILLCFVIRPAPAPVWPMEPIRPYSSSMLGTDGTSTKRGGEPDHHADATPPPPSLSIPGG